MSRNNNGTTIDDTENLNLVMPMYNLIEYSSDYSETTKSLWFYSKDQAIILRIIFKTLYKAKLLGKILKNATISVHKIFK